MAQTNRSPSPYAYAKSKPVFLLIPPDAKTVYVIQSNTNYVEKGLSMENLAQLGGTLSLPAG